MDLRAETAGTSAEALLGLEALLDLPVNLSLEVGRTSISIRDLLQLTAGSVIALERDISEPFDVLCNGTLVARGEAVAVEQRCAVRFTDVVKADEPRNAAGR
jgi:flagellar motor switch protein FliN